ncbi:hypothetical protein [Actinoplanes sp. NPDC048796]
MRTLRRYHEAGRPDPAAVDPFTGYRHYKPDQIATARVIGHPRRLGAPDA